MRRARRRPAGRPVAAVVVETPLAHLDRVFEYAVPDELAQDAEPGAGAGALLRARARRLRRRAPGAAEHRGRLTTLRRVVSPEPVLTPEVLALCRAVADR